MCCVRPIRQTQQNVNAMAYMPQGEELCQNTQNANYDAEYG